MKFSIDTDALSSTASGMGKISSNVSSIHCNKYKADAEDGIDFSTARSVLAANISSCADRVKATGSIINEVVNQHTDLQKSLTFEKYLNPPKENNNGGNSGSGGYGRGRSSGGGYSSGYSSDGQFIENSASFIETGIAMGSLVGVARNPQIDKMSYANVDFNKLTEASKEVMKAAEEKEGYLMINGRYVIACPPDVGNVGDVLRFKSKDGKIVECVVGVNTVTSGNAGKVYLLVKDSSKAKAVDFGDIITAKDTTVTTIGKYNDNNLEKNQTNLDIEQAVGGEASKEIKDALSDNKAETADGSTTNTDANSEGTNNADTTSTETSTESTTNADATNTETSTETAVESNTTATDSNPETTETNENVDSNEGGSVNA